MEQEILKQILGELKELRVKVDKIDTLEQGQNSLMQDMKEVKKDVKDIKRDLKEAWKDILNLDKRAEKLKVVK